MSDEGILDNEGILDDEGILDNEGILVNVLLRLPVDCLYRFACVSASWYDLIHGSYFRQMRHLIDSSKLAEMMHSKRGIQSADSGYGSKIITKVGTKFYTFDTLVKNGRKGFKAIAKKLRISQYAKAALMESKYDSIYMAGCCNGLICVSNLDTGAFIVWNPYINSVLTSGALASPPYEFSSSYRRGAIQDAFGYDHLNDDFKLVKWHLNDAPLFDGKGEDLYELCVYSFKHRSWTTITDAGKLDVLPTTDGYLPGDCTFVNGAMHWVVGDIWAGRRYKTNWILAFDLGTYKFREIPCAQPFPEDADYLKMTLSCLNGCLQLGYTYTCPTQGFGISDGPRSVDIWVMKEYGVERSWTKLASIVDQLPADRYLSRCWHFQAVAYSEKRKKLLLQPLAIYDLNTKSLRHVALGIRRRGYPSSCVCVKSFVSPFLLHYKKYDN